MKVLVTGGGGFLGKRIVELLVERGDEVTFLARGRYPEVEALGARGLQTDLRDAEAVSQAVHGQDAILHVAAKAGFFGPIAEYRAINVDGTRNLLDAAERHDVGRLVYTSTPSVVGYAEDHVNAGPDTPYATEHWSPYPETKAEAERMVLAANSAHIATVSLRPHLIFGPHDNNLMPRVVERAKSGRLPIIGEGTNTVDMTYVDNAAWAHLDALDTLEGPGAACAGKAYFISNDDPVDLWPWLNGFFEDLGVPPAKRRVSLGLATTLGNIMEFAYSTLPLKGEPRMTKFLAAGLAKSHWYDMGPAKADFGYHIRVPMDEGKARTVAWFKEAGLV
ncbi:MAG: NAD-dependent epimerase/dehydratase family protein [Alphaproteobacteria bacterium]|nr:NAD-dependent epimerase/dehydratase family protein [Alphaproteobacteria bacterium]MCB9691297.1 NAD-dependent epimerase/dehydratase family protein [Alphaproteobacteria bacterium]